MMPGGPWHLSKNVTELQWPWVRSPCGLNTTDLPLLLASRRSRSLTFRFRSQRYILDRYITPLAVLGYVHVPHQDDAVCPYFHKPKTWPHTHHVHLMAGGDNELKTLAFRDFLRDH